MHKVIGIIILILLIAAVAITIVVDLRLEERNQDCISGNSVACQQIQTCQENWILSGLFIKDKTTTIFLPIISK